MNAPSLKLGFLGFGEAARLFAADLAKAGLTGMVAYSPSGARAKPGDPIHDHASNARVQLVKTPAALAKRADLILALTQGRNAFSAARRIVKSLKPHHLYVDGSAASAQAMEKVAALLAGRAKFVDAAIMGPVAVARLQIPLVASGECAGEFRDALTPYGMNIKVISAEPGAASAMKLIRSVCFKGLSSMLYESLEAAHRRGILDVCIEDFCGTFNDMPFEKLLKRFVCSTPAHAARRAHEMRESMELLQSLNGRVRMTRAISGFMNEVVSSGLSQKFPREADSVREVLDVWIAAKK